ncbi:MAG: DUF4468 domain-containing protein [Bacteroidaceae bacterium]|nr:DUF4468 domain-containing protein [Bacteroidaceae bacterium]
MKKILFAMIIMAFPFCLVNAQSGLISTKKLYTQKADMNEYAKAGAVPEVNGKVVFTKEIETPGKSKDELYTVLSSFAALRFSAGSARGEWREPDFFTNLEYAQVKEADKDAGLIVAQGAEEMVFSNKALAKDYTHVYYLFTAEAAAGKVKLTMNNIAYVYVGSQETERIPAEDWITDQEALNKKGQLHRISGKFRVKTIDLFNELANEIEELAKK